MTPGQRKIEEAQALARAGRIGDARRVLEAWLRAKPGDAAARLTLACVLSGGDAAEREASLSQFEAAASATDDPHEAWFHHAHALVVMDRALAAWSLCDVALSRYANDPIFMLLRGQAKLSAGMSGLAMADLAHARDVLDSLDAWTAYANATLYASGVTAEDQRDAFARLGAMIERQAGQRERPTLRWRPGSALRVALVSADFRVHPVARFIEAMLREVDRARMHVSCLHTATLRDGWTERIAKVADVFLDASAMDDAGLCAWTRDHGVDVAIDLGGHSVGSRLSAFACGLAPLQATYLGHPVTTGIRAIDVRLVDSTTDPVGSEALCVERLVRLDPVFIAFGAMEDAPRVAERGGTDGITFGSFNAVTKLSDACVALWSRVLQRVAGSRLLLKGATISEPSLRERTRARFAAAGVDPARVEVLAPTRSAREHLECYSRVDVALDTFPYHGTTTTCEALWMGVPVVTLMGDRHASRVGGSLLRAAGLEDLVAANEDEYVRIAADLADAANGRARRAAWRADGPGGLRGMVAASALCDTRGLAERFTDALERLACEGAAHA